jgi:hypothetical protein
MKKFFLTAAISLLMMGCFHFNNNTYGTYNFGVCDSTDGEFVEAEANVQANAITVTVLADSPIEVHKLDKPNVFTFVKEENGVRVYEKKFDDHIGYMKVTLQGGLLQGQYFVQKGDSSELIPDVKFHGHIGTLETFNADAIKEAEACTNQ